MLVLSGAATYRYPLRIAGKRTRWSSARLLLTLVCIVSVVFTNNGVGGAGDFNRNQKQGTAEEIQVSTRRDGTPVAKVGVMLDNSKYNETSWPYQDSHIPFFPKVLLFSPR